MAQTFSGFNVPQKWGQKTNYQGGQGGQLVTHALVTWRAIRPRNGIPPGTISGQWEQVPATITSPNVAQAVQAALPPPKPIAPKVVVTGSRPVNVSSNNVSVSVFQGSGDSAFSGLVPAPPNIAGTALFLREDGTWAAPGGGGGGVTSVGLALPAELTVSGSPVTTSGTLTGAWASENNNVVFAGPAVVPGTPTFRALVFADLPAGVGTVTSVGVSSDASYLTVGSTPVTTSGTITVNKTTGLAANQFVATPNGAPGTADLRAIVPADLAGTPGAGKYWDGAGSGAWTALPAPGTGTVTSVAMSVPSFLSVAGSPVTTSGTFAVTLQTQTANTVFSGPTTGIAATPTFRSMVAADLPNTAVTPGSYTYSSITVDAQGRLTSASSGAAPTGTVTSVALSMPSILTVSGSPVTNSGTLTAVLANQNANLAFLGPASGAAAAPTFRTIVPLDLATGGSATKFYRGDGVFATPTGTAVGFLTGKDRDRPSASTTNVYQTTDTIQTYISDGTKWYVAGSGWDKVSLGRTITGGMGDSFNLQGPAGTAAGPTFSNPYTVLIGFNVNSLPGAANTVLMGYGIGAATNGWYLATSTVNANKLAFKYIGVNASAITEMSGMSALTTGVHFFCMNYNGSNVRYVLDGGTVNTVAATGAATALSASSKFEVSAWFNGAGASATWMEIIAIQGFASVLSDADMQLLSGSPSTYRPGVTTNDPAYDFAVEWYPDAAMCATLVNTLAAYGTASSRNTYLTPVGTGGGIKTRY